MITNPETVYKERFKFDIPVVLVKGTGDRTLARHETRSAVL